MEWIRCKDLLPEENIVVMTKIDDARGCRNQQTLKRHGSLWYFPDDSMYVYYTPTHWAETTSHKRALSDVERHN